MKRSDMWTSQILVKFRCLLLHTVPWCHYHLTLYSKFCISLIWILYSWVRSLASLLTKTALNHDLLLKHTVYRPQDLRRFFMCVSTCMSVFVRVCTGMCVHEWVCLWLCAGMSVCVCSHCALSEPVTEVCPLCFSQHNVTYGWQSELQQRLTFHPWTRTHEQECHVLLCVNYNKPKCYSVKLKTQVAL